MPKPLIQTTGRRKEAVARVRIRNGSGKILVNGRTFESYFPILTHQAQQPTVRKLPDRAYARTNG